MISPVQLLTVKFFCLRIAQNALDTLKYLVICSFYNMIEIACQVGAQHPFYHFIPLEVLIFHLNVNLQLIIASMAILLTPPIHTKTWVF